MKNTMLKVKPKRTERGTTKKQTQISLEFRSMMPSEYTAYERSKLREFEQAVMDGWLVKVNSIKLLSCSDYENYSDMEDDAVISIRA